MNVEPLYAIDEAVGEPSKSTVFLRRVIAVLWYVTWALFTAFTILFLCSGVAMLGVEPLRSQFPVEMSPATSLAASLIMIVGAGAFLIILKQLRLICQTLVLGDPFVPENAQRLRTIWIAVAIAEVFRLVSGVIMSKMISNTAVDTEFTLDLRVFVWFLVLALITLSEVFREGTRLRQEQKLTV